MKRALALKAICTNHSLVLQTLREEIYKQCEEAAARGQKTLICKISFEVPTEVAVELKKDLLVEGFQAEGSFREFILRWAE
jgi:hypothetical protein